MMPLASSSLPLFPVQHLSALTRERFHVHDKVKPSHFSDHKDIIMLSRISHAICRLLAREDGPTAVEYAVMLALIIVVCIAAITALGSNTNATFTAVSNTVGSTAS
jgi:pilus assembly protein Flp/PilA